MRCSRTRWVSALRCFFAWLVIVEGKTFRTIGPDEACADFAADQPPGSAWTMGDCTDVWTDFAGSVPGGLRRRVYYADHLRETATELRLAGTPCLMKSSGGGDGVGSTTIRVLSSWILADEMGCDYVTPNWGGAKHVIGENGTTVLYCHRTVDRQKLGLANRTPSTLMELSHCTVVDWLSYFQFSVPSVPMPEGVKLKEVKVRHPYLYIFEGHKYLYPLCSHSILAASPNE